MGGDKTEDLPSDDESIEARAEKSREALDEVRSPARIRFTKVRKRHPDEGWDPRG